MKKSKNLESEFVHNNNHSQFHHYLIAAHRFLLLVEVLCFVCDFFFCVWFCAKKCFSFRGIISETRISLCFAVFSFPASNIHQNYEYRVCYHSLETRRQAKWREGGGEASVSASALPSRYERKQTISRFHLSYQSLTQFRWYQSSLISRKCLRLRMKLSEGRCDELRNFLLSYVRL